jgi:hypothetical protein
VITRRPKPPELAHRCPWCNAPPGERCTGRRGRQLPDSHPSRKTTPPAGPAEETTRP